MSIDAIIDAVVIMNCNCDLCKNAGKDPEVNHDKCPRVVRLYLSERVPGTSPGQTLLTVLNPPEQPEYLRSLVGTAIWGNSSSLMIGNTKFADRFSYTSIRLVQRQNNE